MPPKDKLTKEQILAALARLNDLLHEKGVMGEICIFGGAAMVLAFDARESTRDVDGIFVPKTEVIESAGKVAEEFNLEPNRDLTIHAIDTLKQYMTSHSSVNARHRGTVVVV